MTVRWVRATTPRVCWGGDRPAAARLRGHPGRGRSLQLRGPPRKPAGNDAGTHAEGLRPQPGMAARRPPPDPGRSAPSAAPRLTQQRPQVLQAGQHVLLGVQHLLGGLLHIPVAPPGEHPAAGSRTPPAGQEAPAPRGSQQRVGPARVARAARRPPLPGSSRQRRRRRRLSSPGSRKEGRGPGRRGAGQEGGVDAKPAAPPPAGGAGRHHHPAAPATGAAHRRRESQ